MIKETRYFSGAGQWLKLFFEMTRGQAWNFLFNRNSISPRLSEIISLSVSRVNACANCSFLHSRTALESGLDRSEIEQLLAGVHDDFEANELTAVLYAEHWAEQKGNVSKKARNQTRDYYGEKAFKAIEISIKSVVFGNLCSNTVEEKRSGNKNIDIIPYILSLPVAGIISFAGKMKARK